MVKLSDSQTAGLGAVSRFYVSDATLEETVQRVAERVSDSRPRTTIAGSAAP